MSSAGLGNTAGGGCGKVTRMRTTRRHAAREILIGVAAALVVLAACDGGDEPPASGRPGAANPYPEEPNAEAIATEFFEAQSAFDADRAIGYLADGSVLSGVGLDGIREFRSLMRFQEATGFKTILDSCEEAFSYALGVVVRCTWDFHGIRSDEIGRGPYGGSYDEITVRDGEIVDVNGHIETSKFSPQMWEPFAEWVSTNYPMDVEVMYKRNFSDYRLTEESIRLWERHTREYVEEVAR